MIFSNYDRPARKEQVVKKLISNDYYSDSVDWQTNGDFESIVHWHDQKIEITYLDRGTITFHISNQVYTLQEGDAIVAFSNQVHWARGLIDDNYRIIHVIFNEDILFPSFERYSPEIQTLKMAMVSNSLSNYYSREYLESTHMDSVIKSLLNNYQNDSYSQLQGIFNINILMLNLIKAPCNSKIMQIKHFNNKPNSPINTVIEFVRNNFDQKINIQQLCEQNYLSYSNFAKNFKDITGDTYTDYINKLRISKAERLLVTSSLSNEEIAQKCGLTNSNYLSRVFKIYRGTTPTKFKQTFKEKNKLNLYPDR